MSEISWPTPFGYTIFCDDIRHEISGKTTFVGIYAGEMILHVPLPAIYPKLCLAIHYTERPGESTEPVRIEVSLPGDEIDKPAIVADLPIDQMRNRPPPSDPGADDPRLGVQFHMGLTPLQILKEGRIKVRAIRGEDVIRLGSLLIRSDAPEAVNPPNEPLLQS